MVKKDKHTLIIALMTLFFIGAILTLFTVGDGAIHQIAQIVAVILGAGLLVTLLVKRVRQQRHVAQMLNGILKNQQKVLSDLELVKSSVGGHSSSPADAEVELLRTIIHELAQARGDLDDEEVEVPEATNENIEGQPSGELLLVDEEAEDLTQTEVVFSSLDHQDLLLEVKEALKKDRIEVLLQPVVSLPQRKPRFYECFSRLRTEDHSILIPDNYIHVAEDEGLISAVDNALLFRCIQLVRKAKRRHADIGFFCNISAASLADEQFIESFIDFIQSNNDLKPFLIFEIKEDVVFSENPLVQSGLQKLVEVNCSFSLDQLDTLDVDGQLLKKLGVRFVKIDSEKLRQDNSEAYEKLQSLRKVFEDLRIDLIATKIESEECVKQILDFNIDFGQGYLFSPPRISKV